MWPGAKSSTCMEWGVNTRSQRQHSWYWDEDLSYFALYQVDKSTFNLNKLPLIGRSLLRGQHSGQYIQTSHHVKRNWIFQLVTLFRSVASNVAKDDFAFLNFFLRFEQYPGEYPFWHGDAYKLHSSIWTMGNLHRANLFGFLLTISVIRPSLWCVMRWNSHEPWIIYGM